jgi:hypothetical protein
LAGYPAKSVSGASLVTEAFFFVFLPLSAKQTIEHGKNQAEFFSFYTETGIHFS